MFLKKSLRSLLDCKKNISSTVAQTNNMIEQPARMKLSNNAKNVRVGRYTYIAKGVAVPNDTTIGSFCSIAGGVVLGPTAHPTDFLSTHPFQCYDPNNSVSPDPLIDHPDIPACYHDIKRLPFSKRKGAISIGSDVWIGVNAIVMPGITIGDGAIIGAGAVVTHDVPPYGIIGGVPAKIIRYRFDKDIVDSLLVLKWWDRDMAILKSLPFDKVQECINILRKAESVKYE